MTVHHFKESLALSHAQEDSAWWKSVYELAFPGYLSAVSIRENGWAQHSGIDRVITLRNGKTVTVDEKVRQKSYGDIALEQWSDLERGKLGWMHKELQCDFIAYAFVPDKKCYLLPFITLRRAWLRNGPEWHEKACANADGFRFVDAKNPRYVTRSIAVPIPELLGAISQAQLISWGDA